MCKGVLIDMRMAIGSLIVLSVFIFAAPRATAQTSTEDAIFTITVLQPSSTKDVQLRYFITDQAGVPWQSTLAVATDDKIIIRADTATRTPKRFNAIAYAPGCQFVIFSAEDLSTETRQGEFECRKLPAVEFRGAIMKASTQGKLEVESMYVVRWAGKFFVAPGVSISPLALTKSTLEADGTFTMELPDFTGDPLWDSLSHDATLLFFLVDGTTGHRIAELRPAAALAPGGQLKVTANYPEVPFTIGKSSTTKRAQAAQ